jgi:hypothetical protein
VGKDLGTLVRKNNRTRLPAPLHLQLMKSQGSTKHIDSATNYGQPTAQGSQVDGLTNRNTSAADARGAVLLSSRYMT